MDLGNITKLLSRIETLSTPDFNINRTFSTKIAPYVTEDVLAKGGSGSVVHTVRIPKRENMILKIVKPCNGGSIALENYCKDLISDSSITHLPHGDKELVEIPNALMDGIIGGFLGKLVSDEYTPHFAPVFGIWLDPTVGECYNLQPQFETDLTKIILGIEDIYTILFQVAHGLSVAQEVNRFTHYDLHVGNIFYIKENVDRSYPIVGANGSVKPIIVRSRGFTIKIADYGLSRMETDSLVISATIDDYPIRSQAQFNRNYDMAAFARSLILFLGKSINDELKAEIYSIIFIIKPEDILKMSIEKFEDYFYEPEWWRPRGNPLIEYFASPSIHSITKSFARKLDSLKLISRLTPTLLKNKKIIRVKELTKYNLYMGWGVVSPPAEIVTSGIPIAPGISIKTYIHEYKHNPKSYTWTHTKLENEKCPDKIQFIHVVTINTKEMKKAGYEIKLRCCHMDVISYLNNNLGVAINGTFFDLNTHKPIGNTKVNRKDDLPAFMSNSPPISSLYREYYGSLIIDSSNSKVKIGRGAVRDNFSNDYAYSGPLLVENGNIIFTNETVKKTQNYADGMKIRPFQCRTPSTKDQGKKYLPPQDNIEVIDSDCEPILRDVKDYIPNCNAIQPGELSHAGNPNPRTMVLTRKGQDEDLVFVYVEGRDDRGIGLDLVDMAILAKDFNADMALNLDGGRSSAIAWRTKDSPENIVTANPNHMNFYPVGNIITFSPKK